MENVDSSLLPRRGRRVDGDGLAPGLPSEATVTSAHVAFTENCGNMTLQELQFLGQGGGSWATSGPASRAT